MKYFYDFEFDEDGRTIEPISLGMVSEDGRELYLISHEYMNHYLSLKSYRDSGGDVKINPFVEEHVLPRIQPGDVTNAVADWPELIIDFISDSGRYTKRSQIELWGYFAAYDHVCLAQRFGPMDKLPQPIPMYTNEVMQLNTGTLPIRTTPEHHALYDAIYQKEIYEAWAH